MTSIIICALICLTVIFCTVFIVHKGLPPFIIERREMTWYPEVNETNPIGFQAPDEDHKDTPTEEDKVLSDKEELERTLQDVASTVTALFRGEVDLNELNN